MTKSSDIEKIEQLASHMTDISEISFGSRLQRKRLSKNITIDDLADRTYISRDFLYALEANEYDKLPCEAYTVGFIRTYCKILDIESDDYVGEYQSYLALAGHKQKNKNIADNMMTLQRQSRRKFYVFVFALLLMILGVGATVVFIYYQNVVEQDTTLLQQGGVEIAPLNMNSGLQQPNSNTQ